MNKKSSTGIVSLGCRELLFQLSIHSMPIGCTLAAVLCHRFASRRRDNLFYFAHFSEKLQALGGQYLKSGSAPRNPGRRNAPCAGVAQAPRGPCLAWLEIAAQGTACPLTRMLGCRG
jgi:hypothetical protein